MDMQNIIIYKNPTLIQPYLLMGFEGWPDAGKVSSSVISYFRDKLKAEKLAEIKPDDFYLFQSPGVELRRPLTDIEDGLVKTLEFTSTSFWFYKNERNNRDLIISLGAEPELSWNKYADLILDLSQNFEVKRIYTIGGTFDRVPHTVEPLITSVFNDPSLKAEMTEYNIGFINYQGPSSIHTFLLASAKSRKIKAASIWGHAPHYIQAPNAKVCYAILSKLTDMLEITIDLDDIKRAGEHLDQQVGKEIEQKAEFKDYLKMLEEDYAKGKYEQGEPLGKDIIKEIEDFLKKKRGGGP